jgi:hypothetical protein
MIAANASPDAHRSRITSRAVITGGRLAPMKGCAFYEKFDA